MVNRINPDVTTVKKQIMSLKNAPSKPNPKLTNLPAPYPNPSKHMPKP